MVCARPWGKRAESAPKPVSLLLCVWDHPSSMSTHETGTCFALNSSIFARMPLSLTFCPNESHVHQPKPRNASGNRRKDFGPTGSRHHVAVTHCSMSAYGSPPRAYSRARPSRFVWPTRFVELSTASTPPAAPAASVAQPRISVRHSPSLAASSTCHCSRIWPLYVLRVFHTSICVRSGTSAKQLTHVGRIHHSLCWYRHRIGVPCAGREYLGSAHATVSEHPGWNVACSRMGFSTGSCACTEISMRLRVLCSSAASSGNGMSLRSPVGPHSVWAVTDVISNSRFVMGTLLCALALLRLPT